MESLSRFLRVISVGTFFYALVIVNTQIGFSDDKVIYGEDNRVDVIDSPYPLYRILAKSTAAMIKKNRMEKQDNGLYVSLGKHEENKLNLCSSEPFYEQPMVADCTGFLVAPDVIVTAGHCYNLPSACEDSEWVFDFATDKINDLNEPSIHLSNIYSCEKILKREMDYETKIDYAVIKLNRVVSNRRPLNFRIKGKLDSDAELVVIGHPSGLPAKISDHAYVRKNENENFFVMNSDTFVGNSGSPVFNAQTGLVEGILVRGERDYQYDTDKQCFTINRCHSNECRGEDATRITKVPLLISEIK